MLKNSEDLFVAHDQEMTESWKWPDGPVDAARGPVDVIADSCSTSLRLYPIKGRSDRFIMCHVGDWLVKRADGTYMSYTDSAYKNKFVK